MIPTDLHRLTRDQLNALVTIENGNDWKGRNAAARKALEYCGKSVVGWNKLSNAAINDIVRAVRRDGPWDTVKMATVMAAAENLVTAELAREVLSDQEYNLLAGPLFTVLGEVAAEQPPADPGPPAEREMRPEKESARKRIQKSAKPQEGVNPEALAELAAQIAEVADPPAATTHGAPEVDLDELFGDGFAAETSPPCEPITVAKPVPSSDFEDLFGDVA